MTLSLFDDGAITYQRIKQWAKAQRCSVSDLIVLAPQNDPFYTGTPNDWALGQWFADLWHTFGYDKAHLRRVHYQIISQRPAVTFPNGKPYENTVECWDLLNLASKAARYLRLVDPEAFNDRRTPEVMLFAERDEADPTVRVHGTYGMQHLFTFPDFPDPPYYSVSGYYPVQSYHLEVWCEKSTMNDVLAPLCQRYGANLQTGMGEMSITATLALVHRLVEAGKPARILYVSDFDPAGQSMPVAVSRKLEYFVRTYDLNLDIRVFPVVLTLEQVQYYQLPRTPIKETERRRVGFEQRHGEGAVELDALEALYPGELAAVIERCLQQYYDVTLAERMREQQIQAEAALERVWQQVMDGHEQELQQARAEHERLKALVEQQVGAYGEWMATLWTHLRRELERAARQVEMPPLPEAYCYGELGEGLYNSLRDYLTQVEAYKQFQGRVSELVDGEVEG